MHNGLVNCIIKILLFEIRFPHTISNQTNSSTRIIEASYSPQFRFQSTQRFWVVHQSQKGSLQQNLQQNISWLFGQFAYHGFIWSPNTFHSLLRFQEI